MQRMIIILIALLVLCTEANAEKDKKGLFHLVTQLNFTPEKAYILAEFSESDVTKIPALVVPTFSEKNESKKSQEWILGAIAYLPDNVKQARLSAIVLDEEKKAVVIPPKIWDRDKNYNAAENSDQLRETLLQRKEVLKSLEAESETHLETLKRLRIDANIIGGLDRIVDVQEEIEEINSALKGFEVDHEMLEAIIMKMRTQKSPRHFERRERELTKLLTEITRFATEN